MKEQNSSLFDNILIQDSPSFMRHISSLDYLCSYSEDQFTKDHKVMATLKLVDLAYQAGQIDKETRNQCYIILDRNLALSKQNLILDSGSYILNDDSQNKMLN